MDFDERCRRGLETLRQAEALFRSWGFATYRTGCEFQLTDDELTKLRGDPDRLSPDEREIRFQPDLLVVGFVEVKSTSSLERVSFNLREWLHHRERSGVSYLFIDPAGNWRIVPVERLEPDRIYYTDPADRGWILKRCPKVELRFVDPGSCAGSGEPWASARL